MSRSAKLAQLDPQAAAAALVEARKGEIDWLDAFAEHLDRQRAAAALGRILATWGLSQAEAARLFGVSRQAVGKWLDQGVPVERAAQVADLAAATDLLVRYLKRERIAAVVRRPIPARGGASLLDLLAQGGGGAVLQACREMFDFERARH
jgi:ParB-like chromosome segregation protein Spo0J